MNEKLAALSRLPPNWDGYGANAITAAALKTARLLLTEAQVVPTCDGGIQLEWHRDGLDIEIEVASDGAIDSTYIGGVP